MFQGSGTLDVEAKQTRHDVLATVVVADVEENHVTCGREPARWKLPKVRDYCFPRRRDARGRSVSKSVFAPSILAPLLREKSEASKGETEKGNRTERDRMEEKESVHE